MKEPTKRHYVLQDKEGNQMSYDHELSVSEIAEVFKKLDEVKGSRLYVYQLQKVYGEILS
jgi:hypothetical protein